MGQTGYDALDVKAGSRTLHGIHSDFAELMLDAQERSWNEASFAIRHSVTNLQKSRCKRLPLR